MTKIKKAGGKSDNPPIFSHEFVISNHADILSCVCMLAFGMLLFQYTSSIGSQIVFVNYNETQEDNTTASTQSTRRILDTIVTTLYRHGPKDAINVVFYAIAWIILHAVAHQYLWERTAKKLHLSKIKNAKYYDSGFLSIFYLASIVWGCNLFMREEILTNWTGLWEGFPHDLMNFSMKFFMLNQMAFWLHSYPELYFMKARKEDILTNLLYYTSMLVLICGAYAGRLQRLALVLLVFHYLVEFTFHSSRLLHYHHKEDIASSGFFAWQVLAVVARIATVLVSVVTLGFGFGKLDLSSCGEDSDSLPLYCTPVFRFGALGLVLLFEASMGWSFLTYLLSRRHADQDGGQQVKIKLKARKVKEGMEAAETKKKK